ncbi:MAG TPA: hypothetical protein VJM09_12790 [Sphingobium sp.]|nr:hypothetical protein [Sphingobium sp.]
MAKPDKSAMASLDQEMVSSMDVELGDTHGSMTSLRESQACVRVFSGSFLKNSSIFEQQRVWKRKLALLQCSQGINDPHRL